MKYSWIWFIVAGLCGTPFVMADTVETIISDMQLPHEGRPHGVPESHGWALKPRIEMGNDPGTFKAFMIWGQLYVDAKGNPATNTRVELKNLKAWLFNKKTSKWELLQNADPIHGAAYLEDFAGDTNKPADVRKEKDGSISVTAGDGYNYHFFADHRVDISAEEIGGIITVVEARLILNDPDLPDDRSSARYLLGVGADYWLDKSIGWDQWKTNGDLAIGRFKTVSNDWNIHTMSTVPEEILRKNPPPFLSK